jgi:hypothetical protein
MLEINARPGRDLRALLERIGESRLLRELDIHRTTLRRWMKAEVKIPGHQHQVIRLLLGDLPGTDGQWTDWRFDRGLLVSPGGDTYRAGDVLSLIILRQQLTAQRREVEDLRIKLAISEEAVDRLAPAANDSRAWG